jgi:homoserine dehydrogenase
MKYNIAFIGFGVVGQGLAEILLEKQRHLRDQYGFEFSVVAVSDLLKGTVVDKSGLDLRQLLALTKETGKVNSAGPQSWDSLQVIRESNADIVIEVSYTDIQTGQPAIAHIKTAFENKRHVVTTNKGPLALAYRELTELAANNGVEFRYEGTVMSGTPVLNLAKYCLAGNEVKELRGILNGTTNYILTEMAEGRSYAEALKKAQELGYAEAKPDSDVEGWDALAKVVILANVVMGANLKVADVRRQGITQLTPADITAAAAEGKCWKLIGRVKREGNAVHASVAPEKIPLTDPLANVRGAANAVTFVTDLLGAVSITGAGAGKRETGFALLADLLDIHRRVAASTLP